MPEPPIPTKWMRLTLCRMRELHAGFGASPGGVGFSEGARLARHVGETISIKPKQYLRKSFRWRFELVQRDGGAALREEGRVRGLLVDHEPRQRKEDRAHARCRDLGDRNGAGPRNREAAPRRAGALAIDEGT